MEKLKKKYDKKLEKRLNLHKSFLIEQLKEEWDIIQRTAKREALVRKAKAGGIIAAKTLLALLVIGGIVTIAAISPNIFAAYGRSAGRKSFFDKKALKEGRNHLKRMGYAVELSDEGGQVRMQKTAKAEKTLITNRFNSLKLKKPAKWDGVWRIIIFDIPREMNWARDGFRAKLQGLEFYKLQNSVFATPYPCEPEIEFLKDVYDIHGHVQLIKSADIQSQDVKKFFSIDS